MPTDFQEFLRQKTAGSDIRERRHDQTEWVGALYRLLDQIEGWLHAADPDGLLEIESYEVQRGESRLGLYDAPAMKIRLDADEVAILPIGRYAIGPLSAETRQALLEVVGTEGSLAGRVDIANWDGERRFRLFRDIQGDVDRWFAVDDRSAVSVFDRARLEAILQDLWS
jgi:hypothetical protein